MLRPVSAWIDDYRPGGGVYDEMFTADRQVRPAYEQVVGVWSG